jgi:diketogulonate reductase-like aldo/keto reductase
LKRQSRDNIFVTTKIENSQMINLREQGTLNFDASLRALKLEYVDLLLMHWPYPDYYVDGWKAMEKLYREGKARAIGVCNFKKRHFEKLFPYCEIKPMVNEIEIHPLYTNKETVEYCQERNIMVEAYCPLGLMNPRIKDSEQLKTIADKHRKTVPQIILRWDVEREIIPLPKSSSPDRMRQNIDSFDFKL